jgi:hypothetical protein
MRRSASLDAREVQARLAPVVPRVQARHAHQHGPHAEVEPAGGREPAHAGVRYRPAGLAASPRVEARCIQPLLVQPGEGWMHGTLLDPGLALELLHEVAVPVQPSLEARKTREQADSAVTGLDMPLR